MTAKETLSRIGKERIKTAYEAYSLPFTGAGDEKAAALLTTWAALEGYPVTITGPTLGRWRSDAGLTGRKKPEPGRLETVAAETPHVVDSRPAQVELPVPAGSDLSRIAVALESIAGALWALKHDSKELRGLLAAQTGRNLLADRKEAAAETTEAGAVPS